MEKINEDGKLPGEELRLSIDHLQRNNRRGAERAV